MKLTLILGTQRSGSTLLCREVEGLGGLGVPEEHLLPLLRPPRPDLYGPGDVIRALEEGIAPDLPRVTGVKLMVSYAGPIHHYVTGREAVDDVEALLGVIGWAQEAFEAVALFAIRRQPLIDQAISRARAQLTDIWHRNFADAVDAVPAVAPALLYEEILRELPLVLAESAALDEVISACGESVLTLDYDHLVEDRAQVLAAIGAHAQASGLLPLGRQADRPLRKIIPPAEGAQIRAGFEAWLSAAPMGADAALLEEAGLGVWESTSGSTGPGDIEDRKVSAGSPR